MGGVSQTTVRVAENRVNHPTPWPRLSDGPPSPSGLYTTHTWGQAVASGPAKKVLSVWCGGFAATPNRQHYNLGGLRPAGSRGGQEAARSTASGCGIIAGNDKPSGRGGHGGEGIWFTQELWVLTKAFV